jgi:hypothetical protein
MNWSPKNRRRIATAVPGATLHVLEGGTPFLWYEHRTDIPANLASMMD